MNRHATTTAIIILIMSLALACASSQKDKPSPPTHLERLVSYMTGSFSSQAQSETDSNFYDIRLEMVPVWRERSDAHWFYVEQAVASSLDKPYRQRVYRVRQIDDSTFESAVYTMEEPLRFTGEWKKEIPLQSLTPDSLSLREGCAIVLKPMGEMFIGSTVGRGCGSTLHGAAYAASEVEISAERMISWDRGFDTDGNQVWGAETGGYVFMKITDEPESDTD